jgi:hypothetical protein
MLKKINKYKRVISFYLRKKIKTKCIVLESDDWGLERAKDEFALQKVIEKYGKQYISRWTTDSLETVEDLDSIFELLNRYKERFENGPILTANFITHNLDYSSKGELQFRAISDGFNFGESELFKKYKEGINRKIFMPQLHGFSHYNVSLLEQDFKSPDFIDDLEVGFPLAKSTIKGRLSIYRSECFDPNFQKNFVQAVKVFKDVFGFYAKTFIPPNYIYNQKENFVLSNNNIELLQSGAQLTSSEGKNFISPLFRKKKKLIYSERNARLDTHVDYNFPANQCINSIETAFLNKVPAIVDIHRANFSGKFTPETRQRTLEELDKVFRYLSQKHPDAEFISSDILIKKLNSI